MKIGELSESQRTALECGLERVRAELVELGKNYIGNLDPFDDPAQRARDAKALKSALERAVKVLSAPRVLGYDIVDALADPYLDDNPRGPADHNLALAEAIAFMSTAKRMLRALQRPPSERRRWPQLRSVFQMREAQLLRALVESLGVAVALHDSDPGLCLVASLTIGRPTEPDAMRKRLSSKLSWKDLEQEYLDQENY
jgi:hypothetical protein